MVLLNCKFFLICLDLATPSTAGAYSSYPNISKVIDFHQLILICFLLLSYQNKILSFGTHIILYLLPHMLNRWSEDWLWSERRMREWLNESSLFINAQIQRYIGLNFYLLHNWKLLIKVFLFAWIPIKIRGYCYFSCFFFIIGCRAQNKTQD